jgi:hypothetical protein
VNQSFGVLTVVDGADARDPAQEKRQAGGDIRVDISCWGRANRRAWARRRR